MEIQLWQPNNHSQWQIAYRLVDEATGAHLRKVLGAHYGNQIDSVTSIEQVNEAEINSNNFKISGTKDGRPMTVLLRRSPHTRSREELERSLELMNELRERDVKVPELLRSRADELLVQHEDEWFVLFVFIDAGHFRGSLEELADLARTIGKLDRELMTLTPKYEHDESVQFTPAYIVSREFSQDIWQELFAAIGETSDNSSIQTLIEHKEAVFKTLDWLAAHEPSDITFQLAHFDLHPHNVLSDGARITAILDFDSVRYIEKMRALAFAMHRTIRQHVVYIGPDDVAAEVITSLDAFVSAYLEKNTLSDVEIGDIAYYIKHEALCRITLMAKGYVATGELRWKNEIEKQFASILEAEYFI